MRFPEAVDYLLAYHGRSRDSPDRNQPIPRPKPPPPRVKPPFVLPPANPDQRRVFAYLRKRGIAPKVIRAFIDAGLLYEDAQYHNCVFVGRDGSGQPRFASKRGTCDLGGSSFKRDVLGSDKKIGFRLPCDPEIEEVAVFEAPISSLFSLIFPESDESFQMRVNHISKSLFRRELNDILNSESRADVFQKFHKKQVWRRRNK